MCSSNRRSKTCCGIRRLPETVLGVLVVGQEVFFMRTCANRARKASTEALSDLAALELGINQDVL